MKFRVEIVECYGERATHISTHECAESDAERLAIVRAYGRGRFLVPETGLTTGTYGQIGHYVNGQRGLISTDTGRVRITVERV